MDNPWEAYILSVEDGTYSISGGASQGLKAGDTFSVIEKGKTVKNPQTGLNIELPGKVVGTISIVQTLGNTPQDEVSLATITDGAVDTENLSKYYITDKK